MVSVDKLIPGGRGLSAVLLRRAAEVALDWAARQEGRFEAEDSTGRRIAGSLAQGTRVRGGDVLVASDGSLLRVAARPQPVLAVRPREGGSPLDLLRAAYELGGRHVPVEIAADRLRLAPDPALADLLRRMGLAVSEEAAPFEPETGACGAGAAEHHHGHGHGHDDHGHDHGHGHAGACTHGHARQPTRQHGEAPQPAGHATPSAPHVHGPGCGHRHG